MLHNVRNAGHGPVWMMGIMTDDDMQSEEDGIMGIMGIGALLLFSEPGCWHLADIMMTTALKLR